MSHCRVLIVEDDGASRDMLAAFLKLQGHTVLTAADGETAFASASHFHPDVVLTDICMPRLSGVELCRQLREQPETRYVPVLAMTALSLEEGEEIMIAGFENVLAKPIDLDQLAWQVDAAGERYRGRH
jgi:two-component system alkaline phosphatase synthesis response regulator PhoP